MQINLTIDATPALLRALSQLVMQVTNVSASTTRTSAAIPNGAESFVPQQTASGCQALPANTVTSFDGTDLTQEEILAKAVQLNSAGFGQEIRELLKQLGVSTISALPQSNFAAFFEALAALDTANTHHVAGDDIRYY